MVIFQILNLISDINQWWIFILGNRLKKIRKLYEPWPGWTSVSFNALNTVINTIRHSQTYRIYQKRQMIMNKNTLVWSKLISFIYFTMKYVIFHAIFVIASCILSRWRWYFYILSNCSYRLFKSLSYLIKVNVSSNNFGRLVFVHLGDYFLIFSVQ